MREIRNGMFRIGARPMFAPEPAEFEATCNGLRPPCSRRKPLLSQPVPSFRVSPKGCSPVQPP